MNPDNGVRAPPLSFTSDCDIPPLTGKPCPSPAMTFALAMPSNSWFGVEPIAVLRREHATNAPPFPPCREENNQARAAADR